MIRMTECDRPLSAEALMIDAKTLLGSARPGLPRRLANPFSRGVSEARAVHALGLLTALAILTTILPNAVYIRAFLQDTFGLLDGVHRTVLGQVAHRDFSTSVGLAVFALPALCVVLGASLVNSLSYAASILLLLNFLVLWHLLRTRISAAQALVFGSLTILMLVSRLILSDDPQAVTLAMNYNRYCAAFMASLILFFIPPRRESLTTTLIDAAI